MVDRITPQHRSWNMSRIRSKNTGPEMRLRSLLHKAGFRYRLHALTLPGKPDLVLPRFRTVIFVHGCYWHRHGDCKKATIPSTRTDFWLDKFQGTIERDRRVVGELAKLGWHVIIIWECELVRDSDALVREIGLQLLERT